MSELQSRFRGALLGVAIGDALGAPFEGRRAVSPEQIGQLLRDPGSLRYTDDTHMTIAMARSLVESRGFDGPHMAKTFADTYRAEPWRGYGAGPPQVFLLLEQGVAWDQAGDTLFGGTGSYGNGAAMRAAPAALCGFSDLARVAGFARQTAIITHTHPLGIDGAVLQAIAIALLLHHSPGQAFDPQGFLETLLHHVSEPAYLERLDRVRALVDSDTAGDVRDVLGNGVAAIEAVPAALYAFLRSPYSFTETVTYAIGLGGDTDTIASMAGALSGAFQGEEAVLPIWRERVEDAAELRRLADVLFHLATNRTAR